MCYSSPGAHLVPGQWLLRTRCPTATLCQSLRLQTALVRPLHVCQAASLCSSRTEPQKHNTADTNTDHRTTEEEEEEEEGPEYIPRKKAKNPMMMIGYAWLVSSGSVSGPVEIILLQWTGNWCNGETLSGIHFYTRHCYATKIIFFYYIMDLKL